MTAVVQKGLILSVAVMLAACV